MAIFWKKTQFEKTRSKRLGLLKNKLHFQKHRRYAQYTEGIETEAKTKQLEQLIIEE